MDIDLSQESIGVIEEFYNDCLEYKTCLLVSCNDGQVRMSLDFFQQSI